MIYCVVHIPHTLATWLQRALLTAMMVLYAVAGTAQSVPSFDEVFKESDPYHRIAFALQWVDEHSRTPDSATVFFHLDRLRDEAEDRGDKYLVIVARHSMAHYRIRILHQEQPWYDVLNKTTEEAEHIDPMLWALLLQRNGLLYYHDLKEYDKGLGILLQAHELFTTLGYERDPGGAGHLFQLAWVYYFLGNYRTTIQLLSAAQQYRNELYYYYVYMQSMNTLGLAYRNLDMPDSAFIYFTQTMKAAREHNDSAWMGIAAINISKYYIQKGEYEKALPYAEMRYTTSKLPDFRIWMQDSCEALIVLAQIDAHMGNTGRAFSRLSNAEKALATAEVPEWWELGFYDLKNQLCTELGNVYREKGDDNNSYRYYLGAYQYRDRIERVRTETQAQKVGTEIVAQRYLSRIKQLRNEKLISVQARNFSLVALLLVGIWLFTLYNRQRLESRKGKQLFENRQRLLNTEKLHAEEQLKGYMEALQEKNHKLGEIQSELEKLKALPETMANKHAIDTIEKLKNAVIITDEDWFRFKDLFENVDHSFFTRLKRQFPDITPAEMRLMALLKLDIAINDMAGMLGVSPSTIRQTAYRFRKKMPSDMNKDLDEIVDSI